MKKEELIKKTKILLKNIRALQKSEYVTDQQKAQINVVIKALNNLSIPEQLLIAYTYFENKKQIDIAAMMNISTMTVRRKLNKLALNIGRIVYGFEDEFVDIVDESWNALTNADETEEQLIDRAVAFVTNKIKEDQAI